MPYTDIVKARAIRRAGRACEICGTPLNFESARFVSAHPIFGILFDQDDCCVLCDDCLADLDPVTRAEAEDHPPGAISEGEPAAIATADDEDVVEAGSPAPGEEAAAERPAAHGPSSLPRAAREAWFPKQGPDDDLCA